MMRDEHLDQLLAELPRHQASEHFASSVIGAIDDRNRSGTGRFRPSVLAAAAMIIVATVSGYLFKDHRERERIEAIERQRVELKAELAALQEQADFDPVVDIGQEDGVHYILDLRPIEVQPVRTAALEPRFD